MNTKQFQHEAHNIAWRIKKALMDGKDAEYKQPCFVVEEDGRLHIREYDGEETNTVLFTLGEIRAWENELKAKTFTFKDGDKTVTTTVRKMGLSINDVEYWLFRQGCFKTVQP